jgi:hypothetical protein
VVCGGRWVGVYEGGRQFRDGVGERVFGFVGNAVGICQGGRGVDVEFGVGVQPVSDPAHFHAADFGNGGFGGQCSFGGFDKFGVYPVHEAAKDVPKL